MEQSQSSMYISLKQLVWSAVIGVLSFQVIAPTVWGHINSILGISFYDAYLSFVILYALTLLVITGIWLLYNRQPLEECLAANRILCRIFLLGIGLSIVVQAVAGSCLLTQYGVTPGSFVALQLVILALNVTLLLASAWITRNRIRKFTKESKEKRVIAIRDAAWRIKAGCGVVVFILIVFGTLHWNHNKPHYYTGESTNILTGFRYLHELKKLDSLVADARYQADHLKIANTEALLKVEQARITMINVNGADTLFGKASVPAPAHVTLQHAQKNATRNNTKTRTQRQVVYTQVHRDSLNMASLSDRYKTLAELLAQKKAITLKIAQKRIGQLLRDHQIKLTYLFVNIFIILISLFLFFRIDFLIKEFAWKESERASALYPASFEFKDILLKADDTRRVSLRLVSDIWLYITVAVWLMFPLFKPVEDDKINAAAPFKVLTLSGSDAPWEKWIGTPDVEVAVRNDNTVLVTEEQLELIVQLQPDMTVINGLLAEIAANLQELIRRNNDLIDNTQEIIDRNDTLIKRSDALTDRCDMLIKQCDTLIDNTHIISRRIQ